MTGPESYQKVIIYEVSAQNESVRKLTSSAHNCGLLRFDFDFDEIFKFSLLIQQNSLESAKCFCCN